MTNHHAVTQIDDLAAELLDEARQHHSRRTARTVVTGTSQRATLIALAEGAELAKHDAPPAATLYVITGRVRLHTHDHDWVLDSGHLAAIPPQRHGLIALTDTAVLLTVALR
jgi:quercetin dioxygenase-like cupin family protein